MKILDKRRHKFYYILFITGLILIIWEIFIYRQTVIKIQLLFAIISLVGIVSTFIDFNLFKRTYQLEGWKLYFSAGMQNTMSWGFIACASFVLLNYYLAEDAIKTEQYIIIDRSSMPGGKGRRNERQPLISINYEGQMKELVFPHEYYRDLNKWKTVTIGKMNGFLNYDIIVDQELNK